MSNTLKEQVRQGWIDLGKDTISMSHSVDSPDSPEVVELYGKKLKELHQTFIQLSSRTLSIILDSPITITDDNLCFMCHCHLDFIGGEKICENPTCPTNEYDHENQG